MISLLRSNVVDLPTKVSLSYLWCGGFLISGFLVVQLVSGIMLSLLYAADSGLSFSCVLSLTKDGIFTWFVRYSHMWGVSFIFGLFGLHMGRSLYYSSYSKLGVWNVGFILYLMMLMEAFLGYILPWHQMSYWAATVMTSVLQSIPFFGGPVYSFIVGGFSVTNVTLVRVFSAHVCLAFIIVGFSLIHLFYLHQGGSKNPLNAPRGYSDVVSFHSFFTSKDGYIVLFAFTFCIFLFLFSPDLVLDVESYMEADPLVTPTNIKPEWYFLAFYAMLRSVESKVGGLVLVIVFLFLLWIPTFNLSCSYSVSRQMIFWWFFSVFVLLSYLGACHPEAPYVLISRVGSAASVVFLFLFKFFWWVSYSQGVPPLSIAGGR